MNTKTLKRAFENLSLSRKIILIGAVLAILLAFMPWFEINQIMGTVSKPLRYSGFSKYGIFGYISLFFALICLIIIIREALTNKDTIFGINNCLVCMLLGGEAIFALTIGIFVFSSLFDDFSDAKFRFGIFLSIFAHILIFGGGYFSFLEEKKVANKKAFKTLSDEDLAKLNLQPEDPDVSNDQLSFGD